MKTTVVLSAIAALGFAGAAVANEEITFAAIDTNADGVLSLEEVQVAAPEVTEVEFTAYDADADGSLSEDEFTVWAEYKADQAEEASEHTSDEASEH